MPGFSLEVIYLSSRTPRRNDFDINNLISRYIAGESVKHLAESFGFSRQVVYRVLRNANIKPRNRSESTYVRMAQTSPEERKRLASAANEAKRGLANTPEMLHKRAEAHKRFIGIFEDEFIQALSGAGIPVIPQQPFLSYNFYIGCGNIAGAIASQVGIPTHKPRTTQRFVERLHAGMTILFVALPTKTTSIPVDG